MSGKLSWQPLLHQGHGASECLFLAKKRSSDQGRGRSGLPSASDIQMPMSAFALISSALHPAPDIPGEAGPLHDWQFANRVWSLFLNGRYDVCADYIEREHANYRLDKPPEPKEVIYSFCARIGRGRAKEVFEVLAAECEVAWGKSPVQFAALRDYFVEKFALGFLQGTHNIMAEYMKNYSEYSQVLIYQDRGVSLGEDARPSSTAFDDTKLFYGNAFEHLATYLVFPACLNNVIEGRAYDTFEKLTLKKYLALNKASKSGPFKANPKLSNISDVLNNQIRNASHHR